MENDGEYPEFYHSLTVWKIFGYIFIATSSCFLIAFIYWIIYYYGICTPTWTCKNSCKCVDGEPVDKTD